MAQMIDLVAWDISGREIHGLLELTAPRLGDALAADLVITATGVTIMDPEVGSAERRDSLVIDLRRLVVAMATGPRASSEQRLPCATHPAEVRVGRFSLHGMIHDPALSGQGRASGGRPWLPMTDAVMERVKGGVYTRERFDALLVNRAHVQGILATSSTAHELRWLAAHPARNVPVDGHAWMGDARRPGPNA